MNRDEFGAIRKGRFNLDFGHHRGHAFHYLLGSQNGFSKRHELRHALPVARAFHDFRGDERHAFGEIQLQTAPQTPPRHVRRDDDEQFFFFALG